MPDSFGDLLASNDLCVEDLYDGSSDYDHDDESDRKPLTIEEWKTLYGVEDLDIPAGELIF